MESVYGRPSLDCSTCTAVWERPSTCSRPGTAFTLDGHPWKAVYGLPSADGSCSMGGRSSIAAHGRPSIDGRPWTSVHASPWTPVHGRTSSFVLGRPSMDGSSWTAVHGRPSLDCRKYTSVHDRPSRNSRPGIGATWHPSGVDPESARDRSGVDLDLS